MLQVTEIRRGNVADLLSYGFWYRPLSMMEQQGRAQEIEEAVQQLEEVWETKFPEGFNPDIKWVPCPVGMVGSVWCVTCIKNVHQV